MNDIEFEIQRGILKIVFIDLKRVLATLVGKMSCRTNQLFFTAPIMVTFVPAIGWPVE